MRKKLILDVDTGTDDAVAIMLAGLHPDLDLVAITVVNGNVPVENCTDNTLRTLDWIGRGDVPVYQGLAHPIVREDFPTPRATKRDPKVHMAVLPLPAATSVSLTSWAASSSLAALVVSVLFSLVAVLIGLPS